MQYQPYILNHINNNLALSYNNNNNNSNNSNSSHQNFYFGQQYTSNPQLYHANYSTSAYQNHLNQMYPQNYHYQQQQQQQQIHQQSSSNNSSSSSFMRHNSMPTYFHSQCSNDSFHFSSTTDAQSSSASAPLPSYSTAQSIQYNNQFSNSNNTNNNYNNSTTKRASYGESLSIYDTLSAANSLINHYN